MSRLELGEQRLRSHFGSEAAHDLLRGSVGMHAAIPLLGTELVVRDGAVMPVVAGNSPLADLDDFKAKGAAAGGRRQFPFGIGGTGALSTRGWSHWQQIPGATPSNLPGGSVPTNATTGAINLQADPPSGSNDRFFMTEKQWYYNQGAFPFLLLYDRIWHGRPTTTAGAQTVSGVPTRYASSPDCIGNIFFIEAIVALPATAHTHSVTYTDQDGNAGNVTSIVGNASTGASNLDMPNWQWFMPLNSNDTGVRAITSYNVGTTLASGSLNLVLGHPLAFIPGLAQPGQPNFLDGTLAGFNLAELQATACLSALVMPTFSGNPNHTLQLELVQSD